MVLLSGCLDILTTRQKQLCLSASDYSSTSIFECSKNSDCFKKVNSAGFVVSEKLPFEIKNKILTYKNNVSSSIYYFNKARVEIQKIYDYCSGSKDLEIIEATNNLMFYISRIFNYQDLAWQKSIEIIKDYAIFLKNNGVEKISEEEIYSDFVLLNKNLNELRDESINNNSYIGLLKTEAKRARELARNFGFLNTYMFNINFVDVYAYYYDYVDNPDKELKIPLISKSTNYIFSKFSTFENFRKINENLSRADNYNLYILFDRHIGTNDSLFKRFITLNNKVNADIDLVYQKIHELEKTIAENVSYLDEENKEKYYLYKSYFEKKELGFGYYLAKLKEIELELLNSNSYEKEENTLINSKINDCEGIIVAAKEYDNLYFKELVGNYENASSPIEKLEYCNLLKNAIGDIDCISDYKLLVSKGIIKLFDYGTGLSCIDVLNQLNYNLKGNEKIKLYFDYIKQNKLLVADIINNCQYSNYEIKLLDYKSLLKDYETHKNYEVLLDVDAYLLELRKINGELNGYWNSCVSNNLSMNYKIIEKNGKIYLEIENPGKTNIGRICFVPRDINISEIVSLTSDLKVSSTEMCANSLKTRKNYFEIRYNNKQNISTRIITLTLDKSLLETTVKNTIEHIKSTLFLGQIEIVDVTNYYLNSFGSVSFVTKKENRILYYRILFEVAVLENKLTNEFVMYRKLKAKNVSGSEVCGDLILLDCVGCVAMVKENGLEKIVDRHKKPGKLSINTCYKAGEEKIIETEVVINNVEMQAKMQDLLTRIYVLNNCEFKEISEKSKKSFFNVFNKLNQKEEYLLEEMNLLLSLEPNIVNLEKEYKKRLDIVNTINLFISQILESALTVAEDKELNNIENLLYTDTFNAYSRMLVLKEKIETRVLKEKINYGINFKDKIQELITLGKNTGVIDQETVFKLNQLGPSPDGLKEFAIIEGDIKNKIKEKTDEANRYFIYFSEINKKDILSIVNEVEWLYSDIKLGDLYSVKYYPKITVDDALRLKKKLAYLDTVSFRKERLVFDSYSDSSGLETFDIANLERLKDLNKEIILVSGGLLQFQEDAKTEIEKIKNNKTEEALKIRRNFENKKYLNVIRDSRLLVYQKKAPKINYQLIVLSGFGIIAAIAVVFYRPKSSKRLTREEKKQKILRHY